MGVRHEDLSELSFPPGTRRFPQEVRTLTGNVSIPVGVFFGGVADRWTLEWERSLLFPVR